MKTSTFFSLAAILLVTACGVAKVKTEQRVDFSAYRHARIAGVQVLSKEDGADAMKIDRRIRLYAYDRLNDALESKGIEVVDALQSRALVFTLKLDIVYGNRALRFFPSLGFGRGKIRSSLEAVDSETGEVVYNVTGKSSLAIGTFGGDMEDTIKLNLDVLMEELSS